MDRRNFISDLGRLFVMGSLYPGIPEYRRFRPGYSVGTSRVVHVKDRGATNHDLIDASVVEPMLDHAVRALWETDNIVDAWRAFFPGLRLSTDVIGIKVNAINPPLSTHPMVVSVDRENHCLVFDRSLTWSKGEGVSYPRKGAAPDLGCLEWTGARKSFAKPWKWDYCIFALC